MGSLKEDLKYTESILKNQNNDEFGFLYSRTTEDMVKLFKKIDAFNKSIYAVLSSSDFLFSAINSGAKEINSFDINPLTYRYYHLRKWLIENNSIDADGQLIPDLIYILKHQLSFVSENEKDSITFWLDFLKKIDEEYFYSNVLFEHIYRPDVPYSQNIKELSEKLKIREPRFDSIDICSNLNIKEREKYDLIYLSNILEYNRESEKLYNVCQNMYDLLKTKGEVICVNMKKFNDLNKERDMFSKYFDYEELFINKDDLQNSVYYKYIKK